LLSLNKYLKISKLIVCLFLFKSTLAQNLIRNGSFENYNTPINWNWWGGDFIGYYVNPPDTVMIDWKQFNSPDYFLSACTHTYASVPINRFGYSNAFHGNGYVGFGQFPSTNSYSEYFYQQLSSTLIGGKTYCLSFYVSKADRKEYALKNIGAHFSISVPTMISSAYINSTPQILNQNGFITDTLQWTQIQGCFTAQGGEQYITIGNFNSSSNIDTLFVGTNNPIPSDPEYAYYYIDDITLIDQTTVGVNEISYLNEVVRVYPNPANDILNIDFGDANKKIKMKIKMTDVLGRELFISDFKEQLNISQLEQGIYFLSLYNNIILIETKKVIKN